MTTLEALEQRCKNQMEKFFESLQMEFPYEMRFHIALSAVKGGMIKPVTFLKTISTTILPIKSKILDKDENFLLTTTLFESFSKEFSDYFKDFWKTRLSESDKGVMFSWFHCFLRLGEEYVGATK